MKVRGGIASTISVTGVLIAAFGIAAFSGTALAQDDPYRYWPPGERAAQAELENSLNAVPTPESLRTYHAMIATKPHVAGTKQDLQAAETLVAAFEELGLEIERHEIWVYLCKPIDAVLEIVWPDRITLPLRERPLDEDPFSRHSDLTIGWNAYSGNGDVTAEVVYANYGTQEDFARLKEMGVEVKGKIVITRYGSNYRGYKAKFAEAAGAAGLIIYTDPADGGFARGLMYPDGGYANETYIQRGSILTLDYSGDPLTPFEPATKDARRLDPADVALPKIPVQPVGWAAAGEVLSRMDGRAVPREWQGGLPFTYRVNSGGGVKVRLMVQQERQLAKTYNIVGTLRGAEHPDQKVIVGCHHDAWAFGAGDPLSGTMVVYECAKSFAAAARAGHRPARTLVFANWAAEEFGLIGSVEWVEAHREDLSDNAVAYINLDMAVMGPEFGSSAAPTLEGVIADAARAVPAAVATLPGQTVYDEWVARTQDELLPGHPRSGHLGGGSDHVGFYCHLGIPSASLSVGGSSGVSYHSTYDNLAWYRQVVGEDYQPAVTLTRIVNTMVARLANAPLLPLDPISYAGGVRDNLESLAELADNTDFSVEFAKVRTLADAFEQKAGRAQRRVLQRLAQDDLSAGSLACVNNILLRMERRWLTESGIPGRPWFRNLYAATDESEGYAAWMLPGLRYAVEHKDRAALARATGEYRKVFERLGQAVDAMDACLEEPAMGQ